MDTLTFGFDSPMLSPLHHLLSVPDAAVENALTAPAPSHSTYLADVKDCPTSYEFVVDVPGVEPLDIAVHLEQKSRSQHVLVIGVERRREWEEEEEEEEEEEGRYVPARRFVVPEDGDVENVTAVCRDGVLKVKVEKLVPSETRKARKAGTSRLGFLECLST